MITFRERSVTSTDAMLLLEELNETLIGIIGNNGTMHVHLDDFSRERSVFLIGYADDKPVCCAGIRCEDAETGEIKRVYSRPNREGWGRQLMAALEAWAKTQGYRRLILECREKNSHALEFYRKSGYAVCANYPPYVGVSDAVCMDKRLWLA